MLEQVSSDNSNTVLERISLLEDMRVEYDQSSILETLNMNAVPLESTAEVRMCMIDMYVYVCMYVYMYVCMYVCIHTDGPTLQKQ